jgi:hypothetical protein
MHPCPEGGQSYVAFVDLPAKMIVTVCPDCFYEQNKVVDPEED